MATSGVPAVFLDKDGTLVQDIPYTADPNRVRLFPDVLPALRSLHRAGFRLVVVSNQSGVGRGFFSEADLASTDARLRLELGAAGIPLTACYYCPHHPEAALSAYRGRCACRKPQPGLLVRAADEHLLDLGRSWMVGDILDDVEAGRRAGCRTLLVDRGNEQEWRMDAARLPDVVAADLEEAAGHILARSAQRFGTADLR